MATSLREHLEAHENPNATKRLLRNVNQQKNGFTTACWGPAVWHHWHTIAQNYTPKKQSAYQAFEASLGHLLPCRACRENIGETLRAVRDPNTYKTRAHYVYFVYRVHDAINQRLGKASPPFEEVVRKYETYRAQSCSSMEKVGCKGKKSISIVEGGRLT